MILLVYYIKKVKISVTWYHWNYATSSPHFDDDDHHHHYPSLSRYCISSSHPISLPLFHGMRPRDHCDLPLPCQYAFPHEKPQWQGPSRSHPLPRTLGMGYHLIFHPFPLFLLSGRDSSIIFFQVLSPGFPLHPLTSRFVMSSHPRM